MSKALLLVSCLLLSRLVVAQQDFQMTQFMFDKLNVNPAYAGANYTSTVSVFGSTLLGGGTNFASGQVARASARLLDSGVGLAINFEGFSIGDYKSTEMSAVYAYHARVGDEQYLSFGIEGVYSTIFSSIYASEFQPPINFSQAEAHFGSLYYNQSVYVGFSVQNLLGARIDDPFGGEIPISSGKRLFRAMLGSVVPLSAENELQSNLQLAYAKNATLAYDFNLMYAWKRTITVGLSYRHADFPESITRSNLDFIAQFKVNDKLLIGSSLTFPQAAASVQSSGAEFSAIWVWSSEERPFKEMPFF